jgi:hypothetical protein
MTDQGYTFLTLVAIFGFAAEVVIVYIRNREKDSYLAYREDRVGILTGIVVGSASFLLFFNIMNKGQTLLEVIMFFFWIASFVAAFLYYQWKKMDYLQWKYPSVHLVKPSKTPPPH